MDSPSIIVAPASLPPVVPAALAAQKRSSVEFEASDRATKRRSSRACLSCRNRKVRCDVVAGGPPCTNCRLDGVSCVLAKSSRGKRPNNNSEAGVRPSAVSAASLSGSPVTIAPEVVPSPAPVLEPPPSLPALDEGAISPEAIRSADYLVSLSFDVQQSSSNARGLISDPDEEYHDGQQFHRRESQYQHHQASHQAHRLVDPLARVSPSGQESEHDFATESTAGSSVPFLPPYIQPLPAHIAIDDLQYLFKKDAITIPDDHFRDELLRTYVSIVHPFMPAIDLDDFLVPILTHEHNNPISLLLFQAVMFASVSFVDMKLLRSRGYPSRKIARKTFFNRVRLLYGIDCERDRMTLVQALLLMTYWYDSPDDEKDTWHWLGIASSLAQVIGLHRDPSNLQISNSERRLRRRLWWSCIIRDRLLALGIRRPLRIRDGEYNVPMLTLSDFVLDQPSSVLADLLGKTGFTGDDPEPRIIMATMCIELAQLSLCLGHILESQYSVLSNHPIGSDYFMRVVVMPRQSPNQVKELARCDSELDNWERSLDTRCRYATASKNPSIQQCKPDKIVRLHQALLHMIFLTALGALHRPQAFHPVRGPSDNVEDRTLSQRKVNDAAVAMTKLAFNLKVENQLRYLSTTSIPAFLSVSLIHLMDIRSPDETKRNLSIGRFYQCVQTLHQLQDMYASADYAVRFLEMVLRSIDVKVPMLAFILHSGSHDRLPGNGDQLTPSAYYESAVDMPLQDRSLAAYANLSNSGNHTAASRFPSDNAPAPLTAAQQPNALADSLAPNQLGFISRDAHPPAVTTPWYDFDSFIPALVNFDTDTSLLMPSDDTRAAFGWGIPD